LQNFEKRVESAETFTLYRKAALRREASRKGTGVLTGGVRFHYDDLERSKASDGGGEDHGMLVSGAEGGVSLPRRPPLRRPAVGARPGPV